MPILKTCALCSAHIYPWQKASPMSITPAHQACHKVSISIYRQYLQDDAAINTEIRNFEKFTGRYSGHKTNNSKHAPVGGFDRLLNMARSTASAFPAKAVINNWSSDWSIN